MPGDIRNYPVLPRRLLARHHHLSPALLSDEQVQEYLLYLLQERQRTRSTVNIASCAMRFLIWKKRRSAICSTSCMKRN